MADILQIKSLSVLERAVQNSQKLQNIISFIENLSKPQDIVDKSGDIIKFLDELDMSFSIVASDLNQLRAIRGETLNQYRNIQEDFMTKINARRETQIQLNLNIELYNPEKLMKDISFLFSGTEVIIQEISKPEEYSILNIINRIEKMEPLILENILNFMTKKELPSSDFMDKISIIQACILSLKSIFSSNEFIQLMSTEIYTTECKDYILKIEKNMQYIICFLDFIAHYTKNVFRIFVAMKENYEIYSDAVEKFSSVALESLFNSTSYYELL